VLNQLQKFQAHLVIRNGRITETDIKFRGPILAEEEEKKANEALLHRKLHEVEDWRKILAPSHASAGRWMNGMLGTRKWVDQKYDPAMVPEKETLEVPRMRTLKRSTI